MPLLKFLYEDDKLLVVDKPAGVDIEGIKNALPAGSLPAHRLDKDTSGVLLVAKNPATLDFLQKQFQERRVEKKYICLVEGNLKKEVGVIETLLGRSTADRRKQKAYPLSEAGPGRREAKTQYKVLQRFPAYAKASAGTQGYTLVEVMPKTGRKHQIRAHMTSLDHPVAGDKLYGFKNQQTPEGLARHFLHASSLKIKMPDGAEREFTSELPEDLKNILEKLTVA